MAFLALLVKQGPRWRWLVGQILSALGQWIDKGALSQGSESPNADGYCKSLDGDKDAADALAMGHGLRESGVDSNPVFFREASQGSRASENVF